MKKERGEKNQGTFPSCAAKGGASGGGHGTGNGGQLLTFGE